MSDQQAKPNVRVGVGVIIERDGKVLFGQRKNAHGAGCWSFAGGHLEFGETWEECAAREVMEETGMQLKNAHYVAATNDYMPEDGKHYITIYIQGTVAADEEPRNCEPDRCDGWHWMAWDAWPRPLFSPIERLLLDFSPSSSYSDGIWLKNYNRS